jgi:predicted alpha/beta-hydrolase family hydrolase
MGSFHLGVDAQTAGSAQTHRSAAHFVAMLEIQTPHGLARAHVHEVDDPKAWLVLGHGAGGGVGSRDLVAATDAALEQDVGVALVEQPYRVAGRRSPPPAPRLDVAWISVVERLREDVLEEIPLIVGGRSSGARVACRTADVTGAIGVLCLAFPLRPPRRSGDAPTRLPELDAVSAPTLVVQGERDPFGIPPAGAQRRVVRVRGDHSLRADHEAIAVAIRAWLGQIVA